jgi:ATP-binding cassette, subfamily G (WHITE), member 2, PDR
MTIIVCIMHLVATEYIPAQRSRGDVLRYRVPQQTKSSARDDLEQQTQDPQLNSEKSRHSFGAKNSGAWRPVLPSATAPTFCWRDLCCEVKLSANKTKRILQSIDGWVKPGTLTALMVKTSHPVIIHVYS